MDWTAIIVSAVTTIGSVTVAWLALRGKIAELGRTATEAAHKAEEAATASHKTEQSINNRPSTLSDRLDVLHEDVKTVMEKQDRQGEVLAEHGRDIKGIRADHQATRTDIGLLRGEDRAAREDTIQLREDFTEHVDETRPIMPMLKDLHRAYIERRNVNTE